MDILCYIDIVLGLFVDRLWYNEISTLKGGDAIVKARRKAPAPGFQGEFRRESLKQAVNETEFNSYLHSKDGNKTSFFICGE